MKGADVHFAVELFPKLAGASRSKSFKPHRVNELWVAATEALDDLENDEKYDHHFCRNLTLAPFKSAAGRQLDGNHKLTALLRIEPENCGSSFLNKHFKINEILTRGSDAPAFTNYLSNLTHDDFTQIREILPELLTRIAPAFLDKINIINSSFYPNFIFEMHVLFITDDELSNSNIAIPEKLFGKFLCGEPVFLAPIRLFHDRKNSRGRQPLTKMEDDAKAVLGVWIYRYRHFLYGLYNGALRPSVDADYAADQLLGEILQQHNLRVHKDRHNNPPSALNDFLKLAGEKIRAVHSLEKKTDQLPQSAMLNELGRKSSKSSDRGAAIKNMMEAEVKRVAMLLNRAGMLRELVQTESNNTQNFGKPVPQDARFQFALPASELLVDLMRPVQLLELDIWSMEVGEFDLWTKVAFETEINPARLWPASWPIIIFFDGVIGIGKATRCGHFDKLTSDEILGIEVILNQAGHFDTALAQSRSLLIDMMSGELKLLFQRQFSRDSGSEIILLDEQQKADLVAFSLTKYGSETGQ